MNFSKSQKQIAKSRDHTAKTRKYAAALWLWAGLHLIIAVFCRVELEAWLQAAVENYGHDMPTREYILGFLEVGEADEGSGAGIRKAMARSEEYAARCHAWAGLGLGWEEERLEKKGLRQTGVGSHHDKPAGASLSAAAVCLHSRLTVFLAYALLKPAGHPNNMVLLLLFLLLLRVWRLWLLLLLLLVCCAAVLLWGALTRGCLRRFNRSRRARSSRRR